MMTFWILRPRADLPDHEDLNPWEPWYDKTFGIVVRAPNEDEARRVAQADAEQRSSDEVIARVRYERVGFIAAWLDPALSTCEELRADGEPDVLMTDVHWA